MSDQEKKGVVLLLWPIQRGELFKVLPSMEKDDVLRTVFELKAKLAFSPEERQRMKFEVQPDGQVKFDPAENKPTDVVFEEYQAVTLARILKGKNDNHQLIDVLYDVWEELKPLIVAEIPLPDRVAALERRVEEIAGLAHRTVDFVTHPHPGTPEPADAKPSPADSTPRPLTYGEMGGKFDG